MQTIPYEVYKALEDSRNQFRKYKESHAKKGTAEGYAKAATNAAFEERITKLLKNYNFGKALVVEPGYGRPIIDPRRTGDYYRWSLDDA